MKAQQLPIAAPDFFCPYCRRFLTGERDGKLLIAANASVTLTGDLVDGVPGEALAVEAVCLRFRCSLKRWLHTRR